AVIREYAGNIPTAILRIAGIYTDYCDSIPLSNQIQRIRERQMTSRVYPGDVTHGQTFVHLEDVLRAIELCIERRDELPKETVLLIGEPETLSYDRLQKEFARLLHGEDDWKTEQIPKTIA